VVVMVVVAMAAVVEVLDGQAVMEAWAFCRFRADVEVLALVAVPQVFPSSPGT